MNFMKKAALGCILLVCILCTSAVPYRDSIPSWMIPLREAVYEQKLGVAGVTPLYTQAKADAEASLSGAALYAALSRIDYFRARVYAFNGWKEEAIQYYQSGQELAEQSLDIEETADGWAMRGTCLSELCTLKSVAWVIANGLNVEAYAKKALALDKRNAVAKYLIACRWAYAPGIIGDPPRGVRELSAMLDGSTDLQKDDLFNVYGGMAYAYLRMKDKEKARICIEECLALYPTNQYAGVELKGQL
jgi:tetratricopeptide (TPR) repeat protein